MKKCYLSLSILVDSILSKFIAPSLTSLKTHGSKRSQTEFL